MNTENSFNEENDNSTKHLLPVVFWAHFRGTGGNEAYRMSKLDGDVESHEIFDWVGKQREDLENDTNFQYIMTNCGVIR